MVRLNENGIADVLAMAFMFILIIFGAVLMHAYSLRPLQAATDRQLELKCEHIYKTLDTAWVENYTLSFLRAAAENLVLEYPTIPGSYLCSAMENTLNYLSPSDYEISATLTYEETTLTFNENREPPSKQFIRQGTVSIMKAGGENAIVHVAVMLFKIS